MKARTRYRCGGKNIRCRTTSRICQVYYQEWAVIAQSVYSWATGWMIGVLGFDSRPGLGIFLFTTASRTALEPTQPPIQWVPGALSLGVKRPGREADHSHPSSTEVKEWVELYLHSPNTPSWRGAQLSTGTTFITRNMIWRDDAVAERINQLIYFTCYYNVFNVFKGKVVLRFNWAPCYEDVLGEWR
jgi:hypothetical protein